MKKTVEDICNLIINNSVRNLDVAPTQAHIKQTLSSCVASNPYTGVNYLPLYDFEGLYNPLERTIAQKLARAIDKNSPFEIKKLKKEYGNLKEFSDAKKFLNKKCKEVWNVYEPIKNVPYAAMKALGITNEPELEFLLGSSIKYYEQDNSDTTSYIISSILKNKNLSYTMEKIHSYLKDKHIKNGCKYNLKTVEYLISEQNYNREQLEELGADTKIISQALKNLPLKIRANFEINQLKNNLKFVHK